jgi:sugar phosphate isomerase/epimerase
MLAISTSFISSWQSFSAQDLIRYLDELSIDAVELEYRIPASRYTDIKINLKQANIKVTSIHNFFPYTPLSPQHQPGGDLFSLADLDPDKRKLAVLGTERTIAHANELEAGAVVLHCGFVKMEHQFHQLKDYLTQNQIKSQASQTFIEQKLALLEQKKEKYLSCLLFSLEKLLRMAEKEGVRLGLENRFHYYELPTPSDFSHIFDEFQGAALGYWHDTGHAHALEKLTLTEPGFLLKNFSQNLIGMHLHDAIGLNDHLAPGKGEIHLKEILSEIDKDNTTFVLELKPGTSEQDIQAGISHLSAAITV